MQALHPVLGPFASWYWPAGQALQLPPPLPATCFPAGQFWHEVLPASEYLARFALRGRVTALRAREAEQRKATLVAGLDMTLTLLAALPPSKYDGPLTKRVIKLADLTADTQPAWLKTPERQQLAQGEAVCRPTTLAQRRLAPSPAPPPRRARAAARG